MPIRAVVFDVGDRVDNDVLLSVRAGLFSVVLRLDLLLDLPDALAAPRGS